MKKTLTALVMASVLAVAAVASSDDANAQWRRGRGGVGLGVGLGILGAAAIVGAGAAYAYPRSYYPVEGYAPYGAYAAPVPVGCPGGYWARRPIVDQWGNFRGYSRPRYFCPAY
jgi:hypothetical protein